MEVGEELFVNGNPINHLYLSRMTNNELELVMKGLETTNTVIRQLTNALATLGLTEAMDPDALLRLEADHHQHQELLRMVYGELQRRSQAHLKELVFMGPGGEGGMCVEEG